MEYIERDGLLVYPIPGMPGYFASPTGRIYRERGAGVSFTGGSWMARQRLGGIYHYIGRFASEADAVAAVRTWRRDRGMHPTLAEQTPHKHGGADGRYWTVPISVNKKMRRVTVHRLVALAMIPNPDDLPEVRHLNDDPDDNCVTNLAWGTRADNMDDRRFNRAKRNAV